VSSSIEQYRGGTGVSRRTGRTLSQIESRTCTEIARVEGRADIQAAQVDAMAAVTQRGLQGVAFISQVEGQLGQTVPLAVSRLQAVADIGALGVGQIVMDTANKLRRV
jgi:hypothetical protein